jgi:molybdopterin-guanine dinucleotide biosynthesis protein MobB
MPYDTLQMLIIVMRVFAIAGFSGTGKTSLVESIVRELVSKGYSIMTIKSSHKEPTEGPGTDTERHRAAGAIESHFYGPSSKGTTLKEIIDPAGSDFLIIEGMKTSSIPKFWCLGSESLGDTIPVDVKAIISWNKKQVEDKYGIPIFEPDDLTQIVAVLLRDAIDFDLVELE